MVKTRPAATPTPEMYDAYKHADEQFTVASKGVDRLAYDALTEQLFVTYITGKVYCYTDVPERVWEAFKSAGSKGTFVNASIKPHYFCAGPL